MPSQHNARRTHSFIASCLLQATLTFTASAADRWWVGSAGNQWNSSFNWMDATKSTFLSPPAAADIAVFGANGEVDYSTSLFATNFSLLGVRTDSSQGITSNFSIASSGGALTVGTSGITHNIASTLTISAPLLTSAPNYLISANSPSSNILLSGNLTTASAGLTKSGPGILTLSGTNAYAGPSTVSGGTLRIGNGGTTGSISSPITNNAALVFNRSDNFTHSAFISGTGSLTKLGAGTLTFNTASSYTGPTVISAGVLELNSSAFMNSTSSITIGNATGAVATLRLTGVDRFGNGTVTSTVPVTVAATGTLASAGTYNTLVNLTLAGGTVLLNGGTFPDFPAFGFKGTLTASGSQPSQILTGTGINNAINIGPTNAPGSLTFNVADVTASPAADLTVAAPLQNNALESGGTNVNGLTKTGPGTLVLSATNTYSGPTTVSAGTLQIGAGGTTGSIPGSVSVAANASLSYNRSDDFTLANSISGAGALLKEGSGTLTINAPTAHTGSTVFIGGTVRLSDAGTLGPSGSPLSFFGGALDLGGKTLSVGRVSAASGSITNGSLNLTTINTNQNGQADNLLFRSGTLDVVTTGTSESRIYLGGDPSATILLGGSVAIDNFERRSVVIGDSYSGAAGTVRLTSPTALGVQSVNGNFLGAELQNGTIDLNGQTGVTVGRLTLAGPVSRLVNDLPNSTASLNGLLRIPDNGSNAEIGGQGNILIQNDVNEGSFMKTGTGTVILAGSAVVNYPQVISGTLQIGNGGTSGSILPATDFIRVRGANNAIFAINRSDDLTFSSRLTDGGIFAKLGTNTVTLSRYSQWEPGRIQVVAGTLIIKENSAESLFGSIEVAAGATMAIQNDFGMTYYGGLSGPGSFTKLGSGSLRLDSGYYSGTTTFASGTLITERNFDLGIGGPYTFTGGTLFHSPFYSNNNRVDYSSRILSSTGPISIDMGAAYVTFASPIGPSNTGGFIKSGPGTLAFTADNTYGSTTTILNGTLQLGEGGPAGSVSGPILNQAFLIVSRSNDLTLPGLITGSGKLTKYGTGTLTLALNQPAPYQMSALSIEAGAINLTNNDLLLNYNGTSPIATLIAYLNAATLTASADFNGLPTTLAICEAADLGLTEFNGIAIDDTTVIAKYTYVGDANLDGQVDALDYERIDLAIGNSGVQGTAQGDLNYDGNVDALDYEQVDLNIGNGVGSPLAQVFIPEPTLLAPLALAALLPRRRLP